MDSSTENNLQLLNSIRQIGISPHFLESGLVYKYVSYERAIQIISDNTLYFSKPNQFNDPFDLTIELIDLDASNQQIKQWVKWTFPDETKQKRNFLVKYFPIPINSFLQ